MAGRYDGLQYMTEQDGTWGWHDEGRAWCGETSNRFWGEPRLEDETEVDKEEEVGKLRCLIDKSLKTWHWENRPKSRDSLDTGDKSKPYCGIYNEPIALVLTFIGSERWRELSHKSSSDTGYKDQRTWKENKHGCSFQEPKIRITWIRV